MRKIDATVVLACCFLPLTFAPGWSQGKLELLTKKPVELDTLGVFPQQRMLNAQAPYLVPRAGEWTQSPVVNLDPTSIGFRNDTATMLQFSVMTGEQWETFELRPDEIRAIKVSSSPAPGRIAVGTGSRDFSFIPGKTYRLVANGDHWDFEELVTRFIQVPVEYRR